MQIGMIGLGKMGGNMVRRLFEGGHGVVAYDVSPQKVHEVAAIGTSGAGSIADLVSKLSPPRVVWLMVPAGDITNSTVTELLQYLQSGDIIIDGGNSFYQDSMAHAERAAQKGVCLLDIGVSGGIWGLKEGYCLMVGGDEEAYHFVEPVLQTLAPEDGYAYVGASGAGHFVKMVHNGIEYGVLEAYGEGFELLAASRFNLDLHQVSALWLHGSVVRSWLLELLEKAFEEDPRLESIRGFVEDTGEGRWTVHEAIHSAVPLPAIAASLFMRFRSREEESFSAKVIAALRHEFGGHRLERP